MLTSDTQQQSFQLLSGEGALISDPDCITSFQVSHDGKNAFSLDGARTKFPSLEHLVDFHKMNCGALPGLLQDTPTGPDTR